MTEGRRLHICPLEALDITLAGSASSHLISMMGPADMIAHRAEFAPDRHLRIAVNDIAEPRDGYILAEETHIEEITRFVLGWRDKGEANDDLCIHCWAGISRSTAIAFISLCLLNDEVPEDHIAAALFASAPFVKPNPRLISLADTVLARNGRLAAAVNRLPEAEMVPLGRPFSLPALMEPR